jgi:hypothetical protein
MLRIRNIKTVEEKGLCPFNPISVTFMTKSNQTWLRRRLRQGESLWMFKFSSYAKASADKAD